MENTIIFPRMVSVKAAAEEAALPEHFIRQLVRGNKIKHVRAGRRILINLNSLASYLQEGDPKPAPATVKGIRRQEERVR